MNLTRIIFEYWRHWITLPNDTVMWSQTGDSPECRDGLMWHDGYWATFWYMLNLSWFKMNDRMTSATGEERPYYPPEDLC